MSLTLEGILPEDGCFPRVSGDEPNDVEAVKQLKLFSPREWG